jgi:hypothetical protein
MGEVGIAARSSDLRAAGRVDGDVAHVAVPIAWALVAACFLLGLGVFAHALLPRYEYSVSADGTSIVIHDRWAGRFQRASWDKDGQLTLQRVLTPF